jgi:hypothetical protein
MHETHLAASVSGTDFVADFSSQGLCIWVLSVDDVLDIGNERIEELGCLIAVNVSGVCYSSIGYLEIKYCLEGLSCDRFCNHVKFVHARLSCTEIDRLVSTPLD